ncbi:hypothetical protein CRYUN_Cryun05aG0242600 [Craigia yunnanensis]
MAEVRGANTWPEELASLVEDTGIIYTGETIGFSSLPPFNAEKSTAVAAVVEKLGRGCRDILQQTVVTEDSFIVQKLGGPVAKVSGRLRFLNEFLTKDRDPIHAWPIIFFVFILALSALNLNGGHDGLVPPVKKWVFILLVRVASSFQMADTWLFVILELQQIKLDFLSLLPILFFHPDLQTSLLEEFGVRLVTYDLPGFGESDPHPSRNLNSSAFDMLHLADAVGVNDKFWVLGYSSGSMHAWAALRYVPQKIAGAAMVAPIINLYESSLTKEEMRSIWVSSLASMAELISGCLSLGRKDEILTEGPIFEDFWRRDVEESICQGNTKPFIEEAVLQVSNWDFSLADLQVQRKCYRSGIFPWLRSLYSQADCELAGFLGPIHIWQGMDDQTVPSAMMDHISRVLPGAIIHKLPNEGHFSYFFFCDECQRQIFSTLFGSPQGPLDQAMDKGEIPSEGDTEEQSLATGSTNI